MICSECQWTHDHAHGAPWTPPVRYRAQVWNGDRWVDGMLARERRTADDDAVRLARRYERPTRVIEEAT
jgi:hypothetical protein